MNKKTKAITSREFIDLAYIKVKLGLHIDTPIPELLHRVNSVYGMDYLVESTNLSGESNIDREELINIIEKSPIDVYEEFRRSDSMEKQEAETKKQEREAFYFQIMNALIQTIGEKDKRLEPFATGLQNAFDNGCMDSFDADGFEIAHFMGQVLHEVGSKGRTVESLNYSPRGLRQTFRVYRNNRQLSIKHGRTSKHRAKQKEIANNAYGGRMGNIKHNDGWNFRGRGMLMITGRDMYERVQYYINHKMPKQMADELNIVENPDLVALPKYSAIIALVYWRFILKGGEIEGVKSNIKRLTTDRVTSKINKYTNSYEQRHNLVTLFNSFY